MGSSPPSFRGLMRHLAHNALGVQPPLGCPPGLFFICGSAHGRVDSCSRRSPAHNKPVSDLRTSVIMRSCEGLSSLSAAFSASPSRRCSSPRDGGQFTTDCGRVGRAAFLLAAICCYEPMICPAIERGASVGQAYSAGAVGPIGIRERLSTRLDPANGSPIRTGVYLRRQRSLAPPFSWVTSLIFRSMSCSWSSLSQRLFFGFGDAATIRPITVSTAATT